MGWASEQMVKFRWRSRTDSPDGGTDIVTLIIRALAEEYTVPVLLGILCGHTISSKTLACENTKNCSATGRKDTTCSKHIRSLIISPNSCKPNKQSSETFHTVNYLNS